MENATQDNEAMHQIVWLLQLSILVCHDLSSISVHFKSWQEFFTEDFKNIFYLIVIKTDWTFDNAQEGWIEWDDMKLFCIE